MFPRKGGQLHPKPSGFFITKGEFLGCDGQSVVDLSLADGHDNTGWGYIFVSYYLVYIYF